MLNLCSVLLLWSKWKRYLVNCIHCYYADSSILVYVSIFKWFIVTVWSSPYSLRLDMRLSERKKQTNNMLTLTVLNFWKFTSYCSLKPIVVGHGGSSAGSYLADPTSPIPSHCASIVATSTLRVNAFVFMYWMCSSKMHIQSSTSMSLYDLLSDD